MSAKTTALRTLFTIAALSVTSTQAFWEYGHIFVARVGYDQLSFSREGQEVLNRANTLLRVYSSEQPHMIRSELNYPFVECSTFADQLKEMGQKWQSNWHFVDTPYLDQGGSLEDYPKFVYDPDSVVKAIEHIYAWLKGTGDYKNNFVYQNIT